MPYFATSFSSYIVKVVFLKCYISKGCPNLATCSIAGCWESSQCVFRLQYLGVIFGNRHSHLPLQAFTFVSRKFNANSVAVCGKSCFADALCSDVRGVLVWLAHLQASVSIDHLWCLLSHRYYLCGEKTGGSNTFLHTAYSYYICHFLPADLQ